MLLSAKGRLAAKWGLAHEICIQLCADTAGRCGGLSGTRNPAGTSRHGTQAFNLSTIGSWFQIDVTTPAVSHLPGQPPEPNGGAGAFLVINNTGQIVTSLSLTLTDTFTSTTAGNIGSCDTGGGCQNFQIHDGAMHVFNSVTLTGINCVSGCGTDSANFRPNQVTYNWSGGSGIPIGATFDITFASFNNDVFASVPGPIVGAGLPGLVAALLGFVCWRRGRQKIA
jgi:hypothetical protein